MKNHVKVYHAAMGYNLGDWIGCEMCGQTAVDIHHIVARGMGGSKHRDHIDNLMALCRACHVEYGDKKHYRAALIEWHAAAMNQRGIKPNNLLSYGNI